MLQAVNAASQAFEGLLDRIFNSLLTDLPEVAAMAGLRSGEGRFHHPSPTAARRRERARGRALRDLNALSPHDLSPAQHLDRLALQSQLLRECEDYSRGRHHLEPNAPEHVLNLWLHELQRSEDHPRRGTRNLRSLLKATPDFLDESAQLIDRPDPVWRTVMDLTLSGAESLLEGVQQRLARVDPLPSDPYTLSGARKALLRYRDTVHDRVLAPAGSFAIGAATLQRRVRDELGLDYTLGQIEALARAEVERLARLLTRACRRLGHRGPAEALLSEARNAWQPTLPLIDLYRRETRRVADAFRAAKAVTFPEQDELVVRDVPEFLRNVIPTAAYSAPGAFARRQRGIFWVNDVGATKTTEAEQWAERRQHFGLPLTCAHEAYPGHHLQFVRANRHPRRWRRLFAHAVFYEGWTLWCEHLLVEKRLDDSSWLEVQQLHDALWRCHRILVDLRLQTGRYTYAQGVRHLRRHLGFTRSRAEAEVNWYTAAPGVPMSYWLGRLENERLYRRLVQGRGWGLRKFNDWLLSFGTLPQSWIEKYGLD